MALNVKLTLAQYTALTLILAAGGWREGKCDNGRKTAGFLSKTLVHGLARRGLLERTWPDSEPCCLYFVTADGCRAIKAENDLRAYYAGLREQAEG